MARKIFICFFVVLLLSSLVVPAFAVSAGSNGFPIYSAFPINEVRIDDGSFNGCSFTWPANYTKDNSNFVISDFTSSVSSSPFASVTTYYTNYNNEPLISSSITLPGDCNKFTFSIYEKFNVGANGARFSIPVDTAYIQEIYITGFYYEPSLDGENYELNYTQFSRTWTFDYSKEMQTFDLSTYLRSSSDNPGNAAAFCYANCSITITLHDYYNPSGIVCFVETVIADPDPYGEPFFVQWFNYLSLNHETSFVAPNGFFDWLLNSVNAFLNFQILPGFSMNSIFYIVLVISVMLAFIKIMH